MKKLLKVVSFVLVISTCGFGALAGCEKIPECKVYAAEYENITNLNETELVKFNEEVATNRDVELGVIVSPYYTMKINGKVVPVYAARSANGIHSFAYVDIEAGDSTGKFQLDVSLSATDKNTVIKGSKTEVVVLPESTGGTAKISNKTVSAKISDYGSYSFVFNKQHFEPLTLMVKKHEEFVAPEGYETVYIEPGTYTAEQTDFKDENTVYYFKKGTYNTDCISLPQKSILYLERGTFIKVNPAPEGSALTEGITAKNGKEVKIEGRGLIDYSVCCGSSDQNEYFNNKLGIRFHQIEDVSVKGLTIINTQTWSICFYDCDNVYVSDVLMFGYRMYADGIMLSDCRDGLIEDNFIRTGDDAFETKSTTRTGKTDNILFQNNAAWTDKAVAYGCIFESVSDTQNVRFVNNSVGFALGTWSGHLGSNVIQMGDNPKATMYDIHFIGTEIYTSHNQAICNIYIGGSGGHGEGWGKVKDIYFRDITAKRNYGFVLNVRTYENERSDIKNIYLDNITSNGEKITEENATSKKYFNNLTTVFNPNTMLHVNTR